MTLTPLSAVISQEETLTFHAFDTSPDVHVGVGELQTTEDASIVYHAAYDNSTFSWTPVEPNTPIWAAWTIPDTPQLWVLSSGIMVQPYSMDLDNAQWVKTNVSTLKNENNPAGEANLAWTVTSTSTDGHIISEDVMLPAGEHSIVAWVKRKTGTGNVFLQFRTGVSGNIKNNINTTTFSPLSFSVTFDGNTPAQAGIRLATSGDSVIVAAIFIWLNVGANGPFTPIVESESSPIIYNGITYEVDSDNHKQSGFWYGEFMVKNQESENQFELITLQSAPDLLFKDALLDNIISNDGDNQAAFYEPGALFMGQCALPIAIAFGSGKMRINVAGIWGEEQTYDGNFTKSSTIKLFRNSVGPRNVRDLRFYASNYTNSIKAINSFYSSPIINGSVTFGTYVFGSDTVYGYYPGLFGDLSLPPMEIGKNGSVTGTCNLFLISTGVSARTKAGYGTITVQFTSPDDMTNLRPSVVVTINDIQIPLGIAGKGGGSVAYIGAIDPDLLAWAASNIGNTEQFTIK